MKLHLGKRRTQQQPASDDEVVWEAFCAIVTAARDEELEAFRLAGEPTVDLSPSAHRRWTAYLDFILRGRIAAAVGHRPNADEIKALAVAMYPEFVKIVNPAYARLQEVLLTVYRLYRFSDSDDFSLDMWALHASAQSAYCLEQLRSR